MKYQRAQSKEVTKVRTLDPLVISIIKKGTLLMYARVGRPISRTHPKVKVIATSVTCEDT